MTDFNKEYYDEKIKHIETEAKDLNTRVKALEKIYVSIERLTNELVELRRDTNEINDRLTVIEKEPGENWKKITSYIITAIVGAVVAWILTNIGLR